jgi:hypothetical protein
VDYLTVFCAQLYASHRIQWDKAEIIPLYSVQSIELVHRIQWDKAELSTKKNTESLQN